MLVANKIKLFFYNFTSLSILIILLTSCSLSPTRESPNSKNMQIYLPATFSPTRVIEQVEVQSNQEVPVEIDCSNNLEFLDDLTIPDGTIVSPGDTLDKQWQVKNSGTCNWDSKYHIRLVAGNDLGVDHEKALFPARSGKNADVRIEFSAPDDPGIYRSAWQAFDPDDQPFGDAFYIEIVVGSD